jgi:hypothetical protein
VKSRDYEEFIEFLNQLGAKYLVVGAHAVAFHARPRATKDLDVFIEPTRENAERVLEAIRQFLGTDLGIKPGDLSKPGRIVQLGVAPSQQEGWSGAAPVNMIRSPHGILVALPNRSPEHW